MTEAESIGVEKEARTWGMLCHLTALCGFIGIPFGHVVGPLIVWLIKRNEYPFVDDQGKEALNFQISMTLWGIVAGILILVVVGLFLLAAVAIIDIVFTIIATVRANNGESYRYPLTIRFLK